MASVTKQKNSTKWTAIYKDHTGKQIWKVGYTDKKSTEKFAQKLEDDETAIRLGHVDPQETARQVARVQPIADHINAYATHLQAGGRSSNYAAYAVADVRAFVEFAKSMPKPPATAAAIERTQVDQWVIGMVAADALYREWAAKPSETRGEKQGEPNAARTINRRVGMLQCFLKWCQGNGAVTTYVLHKYPKRDIRGTAIRESRALSDDETAKLLAWTKKNAPERHDLYMFAVSTGLRSDECAGMTPASFDISALTLTVHGKDSRHRDRTDNIPIAATVGNLVARLSKGKAAADPLFTIPKKAAQQIRRDCAAAGVNPEGVSFHGLRHSFITRLARIGVHPKVTMTLARHRDLQMTLNFYTHWSTDDERAALVKLTKAK